MFNEQKVKVNLETVHELIQNGKEVLKQFDPKDEYEATHNLKRNIGCLEKAYEEHKKLVYLEYVKSCKPMSFTEWEKDFIDDVVY